MTRTKNRAGSYIDQPGGYRTFQPSPLPPEEGVEMDDELVTLLSKADISLGRLDGASETLPNPDLFVMMYVRKEAVLSSQIEGTQASLLDVLEFEVEAFRPEHPKDIEEVVNYISAMKHGLERIGKGEKISVDLIKDIHSRLMKDVRGGDFQPGKLRDVQNWIGPPGSTIRNAMFVPPEANDMKKALEDLGSFINSKVTIPPLIKVGMVHCQFETIHPFLDGNGRVGRLLITFLLTFEGYLQRPLLYLSHFFKQRRNMYYDLLQKVRDEGDWESWLKFFLEGVYEVTTEATETSRKIVALREEHNKLILKNMKRNSRKALLLLDILYQRPVLTISAVGETLNITKAHAGRIAKRFVDLGIIHETTGQKRYMVYEYTDYLKLLGD